MNRIPKNKSPGRDLREIPMNIKKKRKKNERRQVKILLLKGTQKMGKKDEK